MLKMNVFLWTVLLLSASQWEYMCAHRSYDWRSRDCVRFKGSSECVEVAQFCLTPSAINTFSPRWLPNLAGYGGPLLTWLPLDPLNPRVLAPLTGICVVTAAAQGGKHACMVT